MGLKEEEDNAAMDIFWNSLSNKQCKEYRDKVGANLPRNIVVSEKIIMIMAKSIAWQEALQSRAPILLSRMGEFGQLSQNL